MSSTSYYSPVQSFRYISSIPRKWRISRQNALIATENRPSLLCLPDDILLMVFDILYDETQNTRWTENEDLHKLLALQALASRISFKAFLALSGANRQLRALAAPKLHRSVHLGPSWGTERLQKALSEISGNFRVLTYARELEIDLWMAASDPEDSDIQFSNLLPLVLPTFAQLTKLTITVPQRGAVGLQTAFEKVGEELPRITELKLSPYMGWLIKYCPDVRRLSTNDWVMSYSPTRELAFVDEAANAQKLEHFSMHSCWNRDVLMKILERLPHVRSLAFPGGTMLPELLSHLRQHPCLERLELVHAQRLLNCMPMTPALQLARERSKSQRLSWITWYQEVIARMVFTELPRLKQLSLGQDFEAVAVTTNGLQTVSWECSVPPGLKAPFFAAWFQRDSDDHRDNPWWAHSFHVCTMSV